MSIFDSFDDDINFNYYIHKLILNNITVFLSFQDLYIEVTATINDEHIDYIIHIKSKKFIHIKEFFSFKTFYLSEEEKKHLILLLSTMIYSFPRQKISILRYGV